MNFGNEMLPNEIWHMIANNLDPVRDRETLKSVRYISRLQGLRESCTEILFGNISTKRRTQAASEQIEGLLTSGMVRWIKNLTIASTSFRIEPDDSSPPPPPTSKTEIRSFDQLLCKLSRSFIKVHPKLEEPTHQLELEYPGSFYEVAQTWNIRQEILDCSDRQTLSGQSDSQREYILKRNLNLLRLLEALLVQVSPKLDTLVLSDLLEPKFRHIARYVGFARKPYSGLMWAFLGYIFRNIRFGKLWNLVFHVDKIWAINTLGKHDISFQSRKDQPGEPVHSSSCNIYCDGDQAKFSTVRSFEVISYEATKLNSGEEEDVESNTFNMQHMMKFIDLTVPNLIDFRFQGKEEGFAFEFKKFQLLQAANLRILNIINVIWDEGLLVSALAMLISLRDLRLIDSYTNPYGNPVDFTWARVFDTLGTHEHLRHVHVCYNYYLEVEGEGGAPTRFCYHLPMSENCCAQRHEEEEEVIEPQDDHENYLTSLPAFYQLRDRVIARRV